MSIKDYVKVEKEYIVSLRRYFHSYPEESLKEFNTARKIEEELKKLEIPFKRVGETGIIGFIKGKKESDNVIVLRADIDGLKISDAKDVEYKSKNQGYMHACGHDAHTASLLGTAKILKSMEASLEGEVRLFFQQGEEIGQGAKIFIKEGYLKGVDSIFGVHVASNIDVGKIAISDGPRNASCDYFKINVKGKGAHVSTPHLGVDALYIASQIVVNLQSISSRSTNPMDTIVVGVGVLHSGDIYNAVASNAILEGTTRTFTLESRNKVNERVVQISKSIGEMYGAEVEVEFRDYASPLINDKEISKLVSDISEDIVGIDNVIKDQSKKLGADDFAEFLLEVPGAYAQIGSRNEEFPYSCVAHHNELFDIDEKALLIATNLEVDYVLKKLKTI